MKDKLNKTYDVYIEGHMDKRIAKCMTRKSARHFCKNWHKDNGLIIVSPDGTSEKFVNNQQVI